MFEYLSSIDFSALGFIWTALLWLLGHGAWLIFVYFGLKFLFVKYLKEIHEQYLKSQEWVYLSIRIPKTNELSTLAVEQSFSQMHVILSQMTFAQRFVEGQIPLWYSLEIVSLGGQMTFVIRSPRKNLDLVEAAIYAQYPEAEITEVKDYLEKIDYRPADSHLELWGTELILNAEASLPIKTYRDFEHPTAKDKIVDPLRPLFEAMAKVLPHELFAVQILILPVADHEWKHRGEAKASELIEGGTKEKHSFNPLRWLWEFVSTEPVKSAVFKESKNFSILTDVEKDRVNRVLNKSGKQGYLTKIRLLYLSPRDKFEHAKSSLFLGAFKTFTSANTNGFKANSEVTPKLDYKLSESLEKTYIEHAVTKRKIALFKNFKARSLSGGAKPYVLNVEELATIYHLPLVGEDTASASNVDAVMSKKSQPPANLPIGDYEYI